jgi:hypothetical protein
MIPLSCSSNLAERYTFNSNEILIFHLDKKAFYTHFAFLSICLDSNPEICRYTNLATYLPKDIHLTN